MTHHEYTVAVTVEEKIVDKTFNLVNKRRW